MDKEFTKSLITLFDWYDLIGSKEMPERSTMEQLTALLSGIDTSLERLYFLQDKKSHFQRHFRKLRELIFYLLNNLFIVDPRDSSKEYLEEAIQIFEDFLEKIDGRFARYLQGNDQLSKRQLMAFKRDLANSLNADQTAWDEPTADTLFLLKMILEEHLDQKPAYGVLKEMRQVLNEFRQHAHQPLQHPFLSWVDTSLILSDFCEGRYLRNLMERIGLCINPWEPSKRQSAIESFRKHLQKLKAISLSSGRRRNRTIELLEELVGKHKAFEDAECTDLQPRDEIKTLGNIMEKITCNLSADQLALMLRAMDEIRLVSARSMNAVFRQIIPFLCTARKENLSYGAVRSKGYAPEDKDRQIALTMLEKMMDKIKSY